MKTPAIIGLLDRIAAGKATERDARRLCFVLLQISLATQDQQHKIYLEVAQWMRKHMAAIGHPNPPEGFAQWAGECLIKYGIEGV